MAKYNRMDIVSQVHTQTYLYVWVWIWRTYCMSMERSGMRMESCAEHMNIHRESETDLENTT